jgi:hydrogenase/urease accessory protein HupE
MTLRLLALLAYLAASLAAHNVSQSDTSLIVDGRTVEATLTLNSQELRDPGAASIFDSVNRHYTVLGPDAPVETRLESLEPLPGNLVRLHVVYTFSHDVAELKITSTLPQVMPAGHQNMVTLRFNGELKEAVLTASSPSADFTGVRTSAWQTVWRFVRLGIEHIFTGYDHLAFLLCLLVATSTIRSLVVIITSFTIAHSITLALATFGLVHLPTRLTESAIAVSIGYVAAENLFDFRLMPRQYITFFFGLIHGFGFSSVLRDMDLPRSSLALSLFSFNAGVEIGQITFVLLIFPLVQDLVSSGWKRLKPAVSTAVACLAVYWFVERAFL